MIAKTHRFHGHNSLRAVYRKGQGVSLPQVSLKYLIQKPDKPFRLSVVVSRKVDKSAVVRNRIRRRIFGAIEKRLPKLNPSADIIISVHSNALANIKASDLDELIDQLLTKAGLIKS